MEKTNKDKIIFLDEEGEDISDSDSSEMEEEIDKPSISKSSNKPGTSNTQQQSVVNNQNGSKSGQNGNEVQKKKKQRSTNKVSIEELSMQIKLNQQKRTNGNEDGKVIKGQFDWVNYNTNENRTLNYLSDFLKNNEKNNLDYFKLDLVEFEDVNIVQHHSQVSSITDDLYKRILRYGQIENIQRIAKKSGAISKGDENDNAINFRDELYYDQNDPFIDDEEYTNAPKGTVNQRMQLAEVFIDDFRTFDGDLKDFVKCDIFKNRVEITQNLEKKNLIQDEQENQNKKKKKPPGATSSNNLSTIQTNTLSAAIQNASATLNNKTQAQKKPTTEVEKELNATDSVKTQEKKKVKKDVPTTSSAAQLNSNSTTSHLLGNSTLNQLTAAAQNLSNLNSLSQNTTNLLLGTDLSTSQAQQLNQLLQAQQNNLLQNNQALSLDFLKTSQQQLGGQQYLMPQFLNYNMVPNYYDPSSLLLGQLDLNSNMMLFPSQQSTSLQANNFMYPQTQAYNLTNNTNLQKQPENKDKKKKKKPSSSNTQNGSSGVNKDSNNKKSQQVDLIEIEDDDDPSQNTSTLPTKNKKESEK